METQKQKENNTSLYDCNWIESLWRIIKRISNIDNDIKKNKAGGCACSYMDASLICEGNKERE